MRHVGKYANSGAYFGRRGVLNLERYLELMELSDARPSMFYGSQGVFNLMLFEAADRGRSALGTASFSS